ncbi:hypothetical protein AN958_00030 [Leucoagaricus sp. SymC.cos]|nr:hypothetical protein AN958_00030 [Leucoagaricus sp. SymC.cos]
MPVSLQPASLSLSDPTRAGTEDSVEKDLRTPETSAGTRSTMTQVEEKTCSDDESLGLSSNGLPLVGFDSPAPD